MVSSFEYHAPQTLEEALALLIAFGDEARVLAGGTDLLLQIRDQHVQPAHIVNIKCLTTLSSLEMGDEGLLVGALVNLTEITRSAVVGEHYPALAQAAASMAAIQIRNLATVGGNLCNASPAADLAPPLMAYGAIAEIAGSRVRRSVPLSEFFQGPGQSVLAPGELLLGVRLPTPGEGQQGIYLRMAPRRAMDIAVASVALVVRGSNGICDDAQIVMGAVGPTPLRAAQAEAALRGQPIDAEVIEQAARLAAEESRPIDDLRAAAWYRRDLIETLTRRALLRLTGDQA